MRKTLLSLAFFTLVLSVPVLAVDPPPIPGDPDPIPVDGGASLLAAAGVGYGIKRLRDRRMAKKQA